MTLQNVEKAIMTCLKVFRSTSSLPAALRCTAARTGSDSLSPARCTAVSKEEMLAWPGLAGNSRNTPSSSETGLLNIQVRAEHSIAAYNCRLLTFNQAAAASWGYLVAGSCVVVVVRCLAAEVWRARSLQPSLASANPPILNPQTFQFKFGTQNQ